MTPNARRADAFSRKPVAGVVFLVCLLLFAILLTQRLLTVGLTNIAQAALLRSQSCPPTPLPCASDPPGYFPLGWQADKATLAVLSDTLALAQSIFSDKVSLQKRRADIAFALGERDDAARLMTDLPPSCAQDAMLQDAQQQPASIASGYENALLKAYQAAAGKNWQESLDCFRTASVLGAVFMSDGDRAALFTTLGELYAAQAPQSANPAQTALLAGKYFSRAGLADRATEQLQKAQYLPGWSALSAAEQSRMWLYLGVSAETQHDKAAATQAYAKAIAQDTTLREPRLALALLGQRQNDSSATLQEAVSWLAANGPTFALTGATTTQTSSIASSIVTTNDFRLAGYDVDQESIAASSFVDVWLWWQKSAPGALGCNSCIVAGNYLIQKEALVNLMPNAGFEWPNTGSDGVPQGLIFSSNDYPGVVANPLVKIVSNPTHVLSLKPTSANMRLDSFPVPINSGAAYLVGFSTQYQKADWTAGITCSDQADKSLLVKTQNHTNTQASADWRQLAQTLSMAEAKQSDSCTVEFTAAYADVSWDQVLIAQLPAGPQP